MSSLITTLRWIGNFLAPYALAVLFWCLGTQYSGVNPLLMPTPFQVISALNDFATSGTLFLDVYWSLRRMIFGVTIGGAAGIILGTITGRVSIAGWLLSPIFNGLRAIPPVALVPLVVVWAGLGEFAKLTVISWAAFFPLWLNSHAGVSSVDKTVIWTARSLGSKNLDLLFNVTLPAALPQILVGARIAISTALICVIVAEMTGAYAGIGFRLHTSYLVFRVDRMLACMVVLAILGVTLDRLFTYTTSRCFAWISLSHDQR